MIYVGLGFLAILFLVVLGTSIWFLIEAFRTSILWGLGCLLVPFAPFAFVIVHWHRAKKPFGAMMGSTMLAGVVSGIIVPNLTRAQQMREAEASASAPETRQANPPTKNSSRQVVRPPAKKVIPAAPMTATDEMTWLAVSADSQVTVEQKRAGNDKCTVVATRTPNDTLWTSDRCLGSRLDLRFVANDGGRVVVLHPLPKTSNVESRRVQVGHVYDRGQLAYAINAGGAIRDWTKVKSAGAQFYWLKGVMGQPGEAPRYSDDGLAVSLEAIDGSKHSIPLRKPVDSDSKVAIDHRE